MKKLIFLLLLSVASYGQTANGTETKQNAFRSLNPQTVTTPVFVATMGSDGTMGKASVNNLPLSIPTKDYVDANIPAEYAVIVYFNDTNPSAATIFDDENPPTTNDPLLENDTDNLYIGTDASTWVYNGTIYVTKSIPASSNFKLSSGVDAGNNKTSSIYREGSISSNGFVSSDAGMFINRNGSNSAQIGGFMAFSNAIGSNASMFQLNASNGLDLWNYSSSTWNKRFSFSSGGALTANSYIKSGGLSTEFLMADGSVSTGGGAGTVTNVSVVTANGISGSVATSTTTPAITLTLQDANTSQNGQLTSTDWNTFNSKQASIGFTPENVANKDNGTLTTSTSTYPTSGAVKTAVDLKANKNLTVRKISTNTTLADSDNGTIILLTASCTVTLPNGLMSGFNCSFSTQTGTTMTYSLGGSVTLINNLGTTMAQNLSHTIVNTGTSNEYLTAGAL